jgi:hypothetical protein
MQMTCGWPERRGEFISSDLARARSTVPSLSGSVAGGAGVLENGCEGARGGTSSRYRIKRAIASAANGFSQDAVSVSKCIAL